MTEGYSEQTDFSPELLLRETPDGGWELIVGKEVVRSLDTDGRTRLQNTYPDMSNTEVQVLERLVNGDTASWPRATSPGEDPLKLKKHQIMPWLRANLKIEFNILTRQIEIFGEPITGEQADGFDLLLHEKCGVEVPRNSAFVGTAMIARENEYNPFKRYVESIPLGAELEEGEWNSLDEKMLGYRDANALMKLQRQLVGTVRRALQPGYQHDTCLVLFGEQGAGKDSLLRALFTQDFFYGGGSYDPKNKDTVLSMYSAIAVGFSEIERVFSRAGSSQLKDFLTQVDDRIRAPYGRTFEHTYRHFTFWASTNDPHLLRDGTGNRRFPWVAHKATDVEWVEKNRDRIFGTLVKLAQGDFRTWFNKEEIKVLNEEAQKLGPPDEMRDGMFEGLRTGAYPETSLSHMWTTVLNYEGVPDSQEQRRLYRLLDTCHLLQRVPGKKRTLEQGVPAGTRGNPVTVWRYKKSVPCS